MTTYYGTEDLLDSREILERIAELETPPAGTARTIVVDGFAYTTTAPERERVATVRPDIERRECCAGSVVVLPAAVLSHYRRLELEATGQVTS